MNEPLTTVERMLLLGLQARGAEAQRLLAEIGADETEVRQQIADRLELQLEQIGTTHQIDMRSWSVIERVPPRAIDVTQETA